MLLAALAGGHATDHVGAVVDGLLGVEGALLAREALADDLGVLGQGHVNVGCRVAGGVAGKHVQGWKNERPKVKIGNGTRGAARMEDSDL